MDATYFSNTWTMKILKCDVDVGFVTWDKYIVGEYDNRCDVDFIFQCLCSKQAVEGSERRYQSVIWGPTCDGTDKITENYWIPELDVGDWLLIDNMGAYTVTLASTFNGFEKAHIYSVVTAETWHALNLSHTYGIVHL